MSLGIFSFDLNAWLDSLERYLDSTNEATLAEELPPIESTFDFDAPSSELFDEAAIKQALESAVTPILVPTDSLTQKPPETVKETIKPAPMTPSVLAVQPVVTPRPSLSPEARIEFERMMRTLQTQVVANYRDVDIADQDFGRRYVEDFPRRKPTGEDEAAEVRRNDMRRDDERAERLRSELIRAADRRR